MAELSVQRPGAGRRRIGRADVFVVGAVATAVAIIALGFATPSTRRSDTESGRDADAFAQDLRTCRFLKGGSPTQRHRADASSAYVASCLRRRGWAPDGAPTLESVLQAND